MRAALVAIDFSEISRALATYAFRYAQKEGLETLDFVHVVERPYVNPIGVSPPYEHTHHDDIKKQLEEIIEKSRGDRIGINFSVVIRSGVPYEEIIEQAEQTGYEMIFIGHRGMSDVKRFFIGSVAAKVVRHAPCTVLVYQQPRAK